METRQIGTVQIRRAKPVAAPGFYLDQKVDVPYIEQFTPVMEGRLGLAGSRLAAVLNRVYP